jgi:hypothetical protein
MNLFKAYKTNHKSETEGTWIDFGSGVSFKLARESELNQEYQAKYTALIERFGRDIANGSIDPEVDRKATLELFLECTLKDWRGVTNEEGELLEFNTDNARWLMQELPDLYIELKREASLRKNFLVSKDREDAKN